MAEKQPPIEAWLRADPTAEKCIRGVAEVLGFAWKNISASEGRNAATDVELRIKPDFSVPQVIRQTGVTALEWRRIIKEREGAISLLWAFDSQIDAASELESYSSNATEIIDLLEDTLPIIKTDSKSMMASLDPEQWKLDGISRLPEREQFLIRSIILSHIRDQNEWLQDHGVDLAKWVRDDAEVELQRQALRRVHEKEANA